MPVNAAAKLDQKGIGVNLAITLDPVFTDKTISKNVDAAPDSMRVPPIVGSELLLCDSEPFGELDLG